MEPVVVLSVAKDLHLGYRQRSPCPRRSPVVTSSSLVSPPPHNLPGMRVFSPLRAPLAVFALAMAPPSLIAQAPNRATDVWALTNARIETVTRGTIEKGTIILRGGLIEAVGATVAIPSDARVLDLAGSTVYPGFIDLTSNMGLPAAPAQGPGGGGGGGGGGAQAASAQPAAWNGLDPDRIIARELRPAAADIRAARDAGITAVLVSPTRGAFRGQSALLPMRDDEPQENLIRTSVAMHMGFQPRSDNAGGFGGGRYPGTLLGVIAYERQALYDAQRQALVQERYGSNPRGIERPRSDADTDALVPVVKGTMPVFFAANNENEIRRARNIAKEFSLRMTVVGATEGYRALDAVRGSPVVVSVDFPRTGEVTGWSYRYSQRHTLNDSAAADAEVRRKVEGNAATLHGAGVTIALASGLLRPADFMTNVRKAITAGLPRDVALRALTQRPAEIAGVGEVLGSIETGKIANLVVTRGDILGDSGKVRTIFVDGARYEATPAPTRAAGGPGARGGGGRNVEAAQVAGTWSVTTSSPQGEVPSTLAITQNGDAFSGTMTAAMFGTAQVTDGLINGRTLTWTMSINVQNQQITLSYRGEVDDSGTSMKGSVELGQFGTSTFTAEKRP